MNSKKKYRVYAFKEVKAYNVAKAEAQVSAKKVMTSRAFLYANALSDEE